VQFIQTHTDDTTLLFQFIEKLHFHLHNFEEKLKMRILAFKEAGVDFDVS
jgi:hypothetical protein